MEKFTALTGVAAPLLRPNINTDIVIRIERLMYVAKGQLGPHCFEAWRYRPDGSEDPDFVLNKPAYRGAKILIAGENFGCGSSREQAVWSLWDMGFRCVIAPSFGDIFHGNCFQNGMLPIVLPGDVIAELAAEIEAAAGRQANETDITVDLEQQLITTPAGRRIPFATDAAKRQALLEGLDEIAMTQLRERDIVTFQAQDRARRPWIYRF
jgi:3-isopropylmalate/(R)-2-methylmalate dehydratase small subunit